MAQLGAHHIRIVGVGSSNLLKSTNKPPKKAALQLLSERVMKMEFHVKLQELRRQRNITQEELAQALYVSRTAVSKWESGRGYPNIDSLKSIAKFYHITVDELLSGDELLTIAEENHKREQKKFINLVFSLLDLSVALLLFLPLFGMKTGDVVRSVSLLTLTGMASYLRALYFAVVIANIAWGILTLAMQTSSQTVWTKIKTIVSCSLNGCGMLLFVISRQPYCALLLLLLLGMKVLLMIKKR